MNKKLFRFVAGCALAFSTLAGCGTTGTTDKPLADPTNFKFDFDSGAYSFDAVTNARAYLLQVFAENETVNVSASGVTKETSGTLDMELAPGNYSCTLTAIASAKSKSTATVTGQATQLLTPTLSATFEEAGPDVNIKVTITAADAMATSYTLACTGTNYNNAAATAGDITVTAADLGVDAITKDGDYTFTVFANATGNFKQSKTATAKASEAQGGGSSGGDQGGGGGGGAANFVWNESTFSITTGGTITGTMCNLNVTVLDVAEGDQYTFNLSDGTIKGDLHCYADGTGEVTLDGGPVSNSTFHPTWTLDADGDTMHLSALA